MTDLGLLRQFLGLEIEQNGKGIMLSQPQYASDFLKKFNMDECKATKSPFLSGIKFHEFGNSPAFLRQFLTFLGSFSIHTQLDALSTRV